MWPHKKFLLSMFGLALLVVAAYVAVSTLIVAGPLLADMHGLDPDVYVIYVVACATAALVFGLAVFFKWFAARHSRRHH
jgi:NADH:ubiquinone oxidoreductase subunit K